MWAQEKKRKFSQCFRTSWPVSSFLFAFARMLEHVGTKPWAGHGHSQLPTSARQHIYMGWRDPSSPCRWQSSRLEWSRLVAWKLHSLTNRIRHSRKVNQSLLQKIPKVSTSALFWGVLNYNAWFQWVALPQYARFWGDLAGSCQPVMINPHELPSGKLT